MTPSDISKNYHVSRQSVWLKIKEGRIKATKVKNRWMITDQEYKNYLDSKYLRDPKMFDKSKGELSVKEAAVLIGCSLQRIYYHLRTGHIKSKRLGAAWVINLQDLMEYKKTLRRTNVQVKSYSRQFKPMPYRVKPNQENLDVL